MRIRNLYTFSCLRYRPTSGSLGHVGTLRRTAIGSHNEIDASRIEKAVIIELTEGLRDYEMIQVNDTMKERIKVGAVVRTEELSP